MCSPRRSARVFGKLDFHFQQPFERPFDLKNVLVGAHGQDGFARHFHHLETGPLKEAAKFVAGERMEIKPLAVVIGEPLGAAGFQE